MDGGEGLDRRRRGPPRLSISFGLLVSTTEQLAVLARTIAALAPCGYMGGRPSRRKRRSAPLFALSPTAYSGQFDLLLPYTACVCLLYVTLFVLSSNTRTASSFLSADPLKFTFSTDSL